MTPTLSDSGNNGDGADSGDGDDGSDSDYKMNVFECVQLVAVHKSGVNAMELTSNWVVTSSADHNVKVSTKNLQPVQTMYGHTASVTALCVYEEELVVSGSADTSVRIWNPTEGVCKHTLRGHSEKVLCVKVNAEYVVSSAEDDTVRVWDKDSGECTATLQHHGAINFILHPSSILVTASNGALTAWDLIAFGERLRSIPLIDDRVPVWPLTTAAASATTTHLILDRNNVVCNYGPLIKTVELPFPPRLLA